jgi:hypothetical protein
MTTEQIAGRLAGFLSTHCPNTCSSRSVTMPRGTNR